MTDDVIREFSVIKSGRWLCAVLLKGKEKRRGKHGEQEHSDLVLFSAGLGKIRWTQLVSALLVILLFRFNPSSVLDEEPHLSAIER